MLQTHSNVACECHAAIRCGTLDWFKGKSSPEIMVVGVAGLKHQLQPPHEVQHNSKAGSALLLWQGARQRSQSL